MLRRQGERLADAAKRARLDAAVPPCRPGRYGLVRHTGYRRRWATRHVVGCPDRVLDRPPEEEICAAARLTPNCSAGSTRACRASRALTSADPALECATFMSAPPRWPSRRGGRPTDAIHRADAESAASQVPDYPAEFAADGINELIRASPAA